MNSKVPTEAGLPWAHLSSPHWCFILQATCVTSPLSINSHLSINIHLMNYHISSAKEVGGEWGVGGEKVPRKPVWHIVKLTSCTWSQPLSDRSIVPKTQLDTTWMFHPVIYFSPALTKLPQSPPNGSMSHLSSGPYTGSWSIFCFLSFSVLCSRLLLNYGTASLWIQQLTTHYPTIKLVMQGKTFLCFLCGHKRNLNRSKSGKFGRKEVRLRVTGLSELF